VRSRSEKEKSEGNYSKEKIKIICIFGKCRWFVPLDECCESHERACYNGSSLGVEADCQKSTRDTLYRCHEHRKDFCWSKAELVIKMNLVFSKEKNFFIPKINEYKPKCGTNHKRSKHLIIKKVWEE